MRPIYFMMPLEKSKIGGISPLMDAQTEGSRWDVIQIANKNMSTRQAEPGPKVEMLNKQCWNVAYLGELCFYPFHGK